MNVFELFGKIAIDSSGAEKGINGAVKHAKGAESKLASTFKKIGAAAAAAFSVRAIVDFGKQCTQAYANIAAEESAFAQIMGDYSETAQAKLNAVADQTGVASTRMTGAMTSLTAKFKGLGYGVEDATTLAADGLLIASDAAAFWDMSLDESMSHLNSFINGSYEGGEAIGLFANDTQMAAFAIEQGIVKDAKAWAKLDEAQRQATRLLYAKQMMENSGATGQAAKEADAYANVMANLKESWRQFQGVVGKPILEKLVLPAMQKLNAFMPTLTESVQNGIVWLETGFEKIKGYFTEVFTEKGIKWDALPDAMSKTFKSIERKVGGWLSGVGQKVQNGWNTTVQPALKSLASTFGIELPDINLGSIFASFTEAYEGVKGTASKFYADVKAAIVKDADGKVQLDATLSGLFDAGVKAMTGLLTTAGNLVTDIVGKITGNEEQAKTIGEVFKDLFGVAGEVVIGIKNDAIAIFDWFVTNGELASVGIAAVAAALGSFAIANPAIAGVTALIALIGALTVDWESFEKNYPALVQMFEDLTGLDFTNVAESLNGFQQAFEKVVGFFKENELVIDMMSVALGAIAFATGHHAVGSALIAYGVGELWKDDGVQKDYAQDLEETGVPRVVQDPFVNNSDSFIDFAAIFHWLADSKKESEKEGTEDPNANGTGASGWNPDLQGMWRYPNMEFGKQDGANSLPGILASLPAQIEAAAKNGSAAGCAEGVGSIQVTGTVTTGHVMLDGSALVGSLLPKINLALGGTMARYAMRGAD